jgi:fructokinase
MNMSQVWVAGEALMDLIPVTGGERVPMVGGGPANTAKAVARLGYQINFVGGISSDDYGKSIEEELVGSGVDLSLVYRGNESTALAIATIDENGLAKYDFELGGTASFAFDMSWLPSGEPDVIHVGSVATLLEPGASELLKWVSSKSVPVIFDPNVRPSIQGDRAMYRVAVERWIEKASIIKLSEDDLNWLYGGGEEEIVSGWLARGVSIVVVTRAEKGLRAYSSGVVIDVPAVKVELVDSVGAGDTIGAVLVEGVLQRGIDGLRGEVLRSVLERAAKAAAITCSRAGAKPPTRQELEAF